MGLFVLQLIHTGEKVAIKKIQDIFEHNSDAIRILREIKLLRLLRHPDIVEIKRIMLPPSRREFKDIYVVFELMESDLHQVIKANNDLTREHHQFFLYQMLRALKYMHTANVYHRDLKPKNILANANCKLKICDFGLARVAFNDTPTTIYWTDYVATRWYMAPELCGSFSSKVMRDTLPDLFDAQPDLLFQLVTMLNPSVLQENGVPVYSCTSSSVAAHSTQTKRSDLVTCILQKMVAIPF